MVICMLKRKFLYEILKDELLAFESYQEDLESINKKNDSPKYKVVPAA